MAKEKYTALDGRIYERTIEDGEVKTSVAGILFMSSPAVPEDPQRTRRKVFRPDGDEMWFFSTETDAATAFSLARSIVALLIKQGWQPPEGW